jgi:predicted RNA-binding protein
MCESSIIKKKNGEEIVLAEDIDFIKVISKGKLLIRTVLGEERYIDGEIEEVDLHGHRVIIKNDQ